MTWTMTWTVTQGMLLRTFTLVSLAVLLAGAWSTSVLGQRNALTPDRQVTRPLNPARPTTYRDVLVYGLKARLPSELAYVNSVVRAVENGDIPTRLVNQTFFWARKHTGQTMYGQTNRPIIYFIPALNARLKKLQLHVDLDGGLP